MDISGGVIGCIRISMDGQISRLAVMSEHRHKGIGQSLVELATIKAVRLGLPEVRSEALATLDHFYTRAGFTKRGESFDGFGLEHQTYFKATDGEDLHQAPVRTAGKDGHYTDAGITYQLGEDNNLIMLRREEDFRNVILEMTGQALQSIRIYSPLLEHKLFDNLELLEICSALARKNRYTSIEILLYEAHRAVKNGHALLEISRKLPSSIKMKIVHPDYRRLNHEYVLVDSAGVIYRLDHEDFDGYANFSDKTECGRMGRQFQAAWESGLNDPDLRQIRI
jgi:ribosomal protein S18 acetylase RimI-like enzyme